MRLRFLRALIRHWRGGALSLCAATLAVIIIDAWPHPPLSAHTPTSTAVYDAHGKLLRLTLASDDKYRLWIPLSEHPAALIDAVKLQEDQWFDWHPGFNPVSLVRGAWISYAANSGRGLQGGSTLTMQLARVMGRTNTRTVAGKLRQIAAALWLELRYSKDEILEAYLNLAPYGGNIEGAAAASLIYFDKAPRDLGLPESLTLAVIPQNPGARARCPRTQPICGAERASELHQARRRLLARWQVHHRTDPAIAAVMALPVDLRPPHRLPFEAPHFVERSMRDEQSAARPARVVTTLDLRLQRAIERQIAQHIGRERARGVTNAAALLVDTRDMSIKALVGSADFFDANIAGQVNASRAKRSPGSTLKPLLYALALDQGLLHPRTVLRDVPTSFGAFTPENFDGGFLGPVTATEALVRSRNIPAVSVAARLSNPGFYDFLKTAGISRMASERHYGLALVLGGGEVTMEESATLYAMLANGGVLRPLRTRANDPASTGTRLLSAEASFIALEMLRENRRPDAAFAARAARLPVYWKTGTSWGFRDAWTTGIFGPYVLIVWVGNFDGSGNPALIGVDMAAPLFFRIVDALQAHDATLAEPLRLPPPGVRRVEVCIASGDLPNAWCPERAQTWFIPGKSPIRISRLHRQALIDTRTGRVACSPIDPAFVRAEVFEYWPSDLARVFRQAGMPRRAPPVAGDCGGSALAQAPAQDEEAVQITSPKRGASYTLRRGYGRAQTQPQSIVFNATVDASVGHVFWFVDNAYVGKSAPADTLTWAARAPGSYAVLAVDDRGRSDTRELRVIAER
ncbi:MAG: penicillin-binding protein 1C [Lysobacterales bacterium]